MVRRPAASRPAHTLLGTKRCLYHCACWTGCGGACMGTGAPGARSFATLHVHLRANPVRVVGFRGQGLWVDAHPSLLLRVRAQVPQGATPRSLHVHLRGSLTRCAKPGDAVTVSGVFLPQPLTGFRVRATPWCSCSCKWLPTTAKSAHTMCTAWLGVPAQGMPDYLRFRAE